MKTKVVAFYLACAFCTVVWCENISVRAGKTVKVEAGRVFTGDVLVKTGEGILDLSGARLANAGLEIREGAVRFAGGDVSSVTARYLKWNVTKTRPGKSGPPEYANSGSQFSEFRLFLNGKMLPRPQNATAMNPGGREGPQMGIDGDLKTKCYRNPFIADFGEYVTFDGYSFVTANDAIGRDPYAWNVDVGIADGSAISWVRVGAVDKFEAPKARHTEAGKIFPVHLYDAVPLNYPVTICGKGELILADVTENLEKVSGSGLIRLENASVGIEADCAFSGSVAGNGAVQYKHR